MLKRILIAAVIAIVNPALAPAQDIFWSFDSEQLVTNLVHDFSVATGSVYIFSDGDFGFDALDLDFSISDSDLIRFTGGEAFNEDLLFGTRFDSTEITISTDGLAGNLLSVSVIGIGIEPALSSFDPLFDPTIGPNGAFLLDRIDFEFLGVGSGDLEFTLGELGAIRLPEEALDPSFGSATIGNVPLPLIGDVNQNSIVTFLDIQPFISLLIAGQFQVEADCDFDGVVSFFDIDDFIDILER